MSSIVGQTKSFVRDNFDDTNFPNNEFLLKTDGSNGSNNDTFVDGSPNNNTITKSGSPIQGTFSPFSSGWSFEGGSTNVTRFAPLNFDGHPTNDTSAAFNLVGQEYTIECWVYLNSYNAIDTTRGSSIICAVHRDDENIQIINSVYSGGVYKPGELRFSYYWGGTGGSENVDSNTILELNRWYHIAVTKEGDAPGTVRIYIDGVLKGIKTDWNYNPTNRNYNKEFHIGGRNISSYPDINEFDGYISNVRVVKGRALYTSDSFVVPTKPLTAVSGTSLLTCQDNRLIDNSSYSHPYHINGLASFKPISPFRPLDTGNDNTVLRRDGSAYFKGAASIGNSDCLTTPSITDFSFGTGDFTIEAWVYWENYNDWKYIVDTRNSSYTSGVWGFIGGYQTGLLRFNDSTQDLDTSSNVQVPLYQWTHVAVSRTSGTLKMYINGVSGYTNTNNTASTNAPPSGSGNITIGSRYLKEKPFYGYLSNLRIVKGTGLYPNDFTPPTGPLTPVPNTKLLLNFNNYSIYDVTGKTNIKTLGSSIQTDTDVKFYEEGVVKFTRANTDYLELENKPELQMGAADFTIEYWAYYLGTGSTNAMLISFANNSWYGIRTTHKGDGGLDVLVSISGTSWDWTQTITGSYNNKWTHIALTRTGNIWRFFADGEMVASAVISGTVFSYDYLHIGRLTNHANFYFDGYLSNLRITKGISRYTSNFTPPTGDFEYTKETRLLIEADGNHDQTNASIVDSSSFNRSVTNPNSGVTQGGFGPFSPKGWSMYVDGTDTTQGIVGPTVSSTLGTGTGDWTVEFWWKLDSYSNAAGTVTNLPLVNSKDWYGFGASAFWFDYFHNQNQLRFVVSHPSATESAIYSSFTAQLNNWYHIVGVKQGNTLRLYLDGQQVASGSCSNLSANGFRNNTGGICVGRWVSFASNSPTTSRYGRGYYSNVRVTSSAVYPDGTTFTPSTEPLTAITDCTLLTLQDNRYVDNSSLNSTITAYDSAAIKPTSPFTGDRQYRKQNYYSVKFDGNEDYLTGPNSSDFNLSGNFTVEGWFNISALPTANIGGNQYSGLVAYTNGSSNSGWEMYVDHTNNLLVFKKYGYNSRIISSFTCTLNTWYHVAVVKDTSTRYIFINGVSQTLTTDDFAWTTPTGSPILYIGSGWSSVSSGYKHQLNGYLSNVRIVNGTALYTSDFTPSTRPLTSVGNTKLLTCQDYYFVDRSSSAHSITVNGNASIIAQSPFSNGTYPNTGTYYSWNFDGNSDLQISASSDFNFSSGSWTIECWGYFEGGDSPHIWTSGSNNTNRIILYRHPTNKQLSYLQALNNQWSGANSVNAIPDNTWFHSAVVCDGTTVKLYVNGVYQNQVNKDIQNNNNNFGIGHNIYTPTVSTDRLTGYVSNLRVVKGTELYTADFVPQSEPLNSIVLKDSFTALLTLQDSTIVDNSSSSHPIVKNGDVNVKSINPFKSSDRSNTNYSVYFDGTTNAYIDLESSNLPIGNEQYTIEAWVYFNALGSTRGHIARWGNENVTGQSCALRLDNAGTGFHHYWWSNDLDTGNIGLVTGKWYHVVAQYDGTTRSIYVDGVLKASDTPTGHNMTSTNLRVGASIAYQDHLSGYISNLRIRNVATYSGSSFTVPKSPLENLTGTKLLICNSETIVDNGLQKRTTTAGSSPYVLGFSPFDSPKIRINENGSYSFLANYYRCSNTSDFAFGTGDFTIEYWVYTDGSGNAFNVDTRATLFGAGAGFSFKDAPKVWGGAENSFVYNNSSNKTYGYNQWHHIAFSRKSNTLYVFVDGILDGSTTWTRNLSEGGAIFGTNTNVDYGAHSPYTGNMTGLRIIKGTALYTSNFIPPSEPPKDITNTKAIFNATNEGIKDLTGNFVVHTNGNVKVETAIKKSGSSSIKFSGSSGDFIKIPNDPRLNFLGSDFTVECWFYLNSIGSSTYHIILTTRDNSSIYSPLIIYENNGEFELYSSSNGSTWDIFSNKTFGKFNANQWHHVVVERYGNEFIGYLDGVSTHLTTSSSSLTTLGTNSIYIGGDNDATYQYPFNGYIDRYRIVVGKAVYTSGAEQFTVPQKRFTSI